MANWEVFGPMASEIIGAPLFGPDGRMWFADCYQPVSSGSTAIKAVTSAGVVTTYTVQALTGGQAAKECITDGSNVYFRYDSLYPREYLATVTTGGVVTNTTLAAPTGMNGLCLVGSSCVVVGTNASGQAAAASCTLAGVYGQSVGYTGGGFPTSLYDCIYDGSLVWATGNNATILSINPAALGTKTLYTLPATPYNGQMGYDGTYAYIPTATGVIVYALGGAATLYTGTLGMVACYYSNHLLALGLNPVVMCDTGRNIYAMPAGGSVSGLWTLLGTIASGSLAGASGVVIGFGDGPNGKLWATTQVTASTTQCWCIVYPVASGQLVMPL